MSTYEVEVQIAPAFVGLVSADKLAHIVRLVLEHEEQPAELEVTLVITDDEQIRALNRDYRQTDSATDVLSFAWGEDRQDEEGEEISPFILPEGLPRYLGDIIVSYPTALAQAAEQGHRVEQELALLIIHGCLHLLGYDHATEEDQERMWAQQDAILRSVA